MATNWYCDGVRRRDFLRVGVFGGAGLSLAGYLRLAEAGAGRRRRQGHLGDLHQPRGRPDPTWTPSTSSRTPRAEYRGEFNPIATNVPGIEICEHLPRLAQCADKFTLLRGVSHSLAAHDLGTKYMNTGNRPIPSLEFPGYGAVVSKELSGPPRPAAVRGDPEHAAGGRLPRRRVRPVQHAAARRGPASRSRSGASRSAAV